MQLKQFEVNRTDSLKEMALELAESLEREMDTAFGAGDELEVARLSEQHQHAELALAAAEQEFESAMNAQSEAFTFWYEEDDED